MASQIRRGGTATGSWEVPYCDRCKQHVSQWPEFELGTGLLLTILTMGLFLGYYWYRRKIARAACKAWCIGPGAAVTYLGWHRTRHEFEFSSGSFARAFLERNLDKVASVDRTAKAILDEIAAAPKLVPRTASRPTLTIERVESSTADLNLSVSHQPPLSGRSGRKVNAEFLGPGSKIQIAGRILDSPLIYVASTTVGADASTVLTTVPVGHSEEAAALPYWPSYFEASPDQRARYLDWLLGGRVNAEIEIGYPFIFFYGLERRALIDSADHDIVSQEVLRLLGQHGATESSFAGYCTSFLAFLTLKRLERIDELQLHERVGQFADGYGDALDVVLAWYGQWCRPLPVSYASIVASSMEGARGGVVIQRAASEMENLFAIRYHEQYGDGLVPIAGKGKATLAYHPASATLARSAQRLSTPLPHVLGRPSQFRPLVQLWNACLDDLKKLSTARRRTGTSSSLTAEAWAALPPELRSAHEHPDQIRWDEKLSKAPKIGAFHILTAADLGHLSGFDGQNLTIAQLRRIGQTGADMGFAIEPEPRLSSRAVTNDTEFAVWRSSSPLCPDAEIYHAASGLLSLGLSVALADGTATDDELKVITQMLNDMVPVDEVLRNRLEALRVVLVRQPARVVTIAHRLKETRSTADRSRVGRLLVLIAAADGVLAAEEHKALRTIYKALGLTPADLDATLIACDLRLASDSAVVVDSGSAPAAGEAIPPAPGDQAKPSRGVVLDHEMIASIMAETRDVASMLSAVLANDDDETAAPVMPGIPASIPAAKASLPPELQEAAASLDQRYHVALRELLKKSAWTPAEIRELGVGLKLMPGGILEAINTWADEHLGDYLIEERGDRHVRVDILGRSQI